MAFQAPWRMAGEYRRSVQIASKVDPIANDPATPPDARERRLGFLARNLGAHGLDTGPASAGDRVLDQAQASSDDHEANMHGGSTFAK